MPSLIRRADTTSGNCVGWLRGRKPLDQIGLFAVVFRANGESTEHAVPSAKRMASSGRLHMSPWPRIFMPIMPLPWAHISLMTLITVWGPASMCEACEREPYEISWSLTRPAPTARFGRVILAAAARNREACDQIRYKAGQRNITAFRTQRKRKPGLDAWPGIPSSDVQVNEFYGKVRSGARPRRGGLPSGDAWRGYSLP